MDVCDAAALTPRTRACYMPCPANGTDFLDTKRMATDSVVRLDFRSHVDMLDFVQIVSDEMGRLVGLDRDSTHWVSVAVRESVINAIRHCNRENQDKRVTVEFTLTLAGAPTRLMVRVVDQGEGFDPVEIANPLAPENLLKASGRGIFFMRSFMDSVDIRRAPEGGMEVHMVKKLPGHGDASVAESS